MELFQEALHNDHGSPKASTRHPRERRGVCAGFPSPSACLTGPGLMITGTWELRFPAAYGEGQMGG